MRQRTWSKMVLAGAVLAALVMSMQAFGPLSARHLRASAPLLAACQQHILGHLRQRYDTASIEVPPEWQSSVWITQQGDLQKLRGTFYLKERSLPPDERRFECTLRPVGAEYRVTGFRWL